MSGNQASQKVFLPLFLFIILADYLAILGMVLGEEAIMALSFLWLGPLDDIFYILTGFQALLFLLDPTGANFRNQTEGFNAPKIWAFLSRGRGVVKSFSSEFSKGGLRGLAFLSLFLISSFAIHHFLGMEASEALFGMAFRHFQFVFPVTIILILSFYLFGFQKFSSLYVRVGSLAIGSALLILFYDGRWYNHIYHFFSSLESVQAWSAAMFWAAFCVSERKLRESQLVTIS